MAVRDRGMTSGVLVLDGDDDRDGRRVRVVVMDADDDRDGRCVRVAVMDGDDDRDGRRVRVAVLDGDGVNVGVLERERKTMDSAVRLAVRVDDAIAIGVKGITAKSRSWSTAASLSTSVLRSA